MKKNLKKLLVILLVLLVTGFARLPFEQKLAAALREQGLIQPPIDLDTRQKLGQTTYAVALGGLRSLVAALLNIRAHVHFEHQEWFALEEAYNTITNLQPRTRYYWEVGSWHLAYNAYADYHDKPGIPEARRRLLQREFLAKGRALLEEGLKNNPDDWRLWQSYARLLSDPFKPQDLPAAADAYARARTCTDAPRKSLGRKYLYIVCRIPGRRAEAWKIAQEVWSAPDNHVYPSTQTIFFALQAAHLPPERRTPIEEIFGGLEPPPTPGLSPRAKALRNLSWYWKRRKEGFPTDGVRETLEMLSKEFRVPDEHNPLLNENWHGFPTELLLQNPGPAVSP